jgi:DNA-binding CsgD family transcriptional regulator
MDPLGQVDQFIQEIDMAQDIEAITLALRKHVDFLGFEWFSYQFLRSHEGPRPRYYITGYPKEWTSRYVEKKHISNDMVSRHAAQVMRPFSWLEIGRLDDFTDDQQNFFNEASEFKIINGGTVPLFGPGLARAAFTVSSRVPDEEFAKLFQAKRHEIHLMATYVHERLTALGVPRPIPIDFKLTPREIEVMTWTARGKTQWAISEILMISERTVRAHIENACHKLNAANATHAIAVSLIHGLIAP